MTWVIVAVGVVVVVDFWVVMAVLSRRRGASLPGRRVLGWDPSDPAATDSDTVFPGGGHGGLLDGIGVRQLLGNQHGSNRQQGAIAVAANEA